MGVETNGKNRDAEECSSTASAAASPTTTTTASVLEGG